MGYKTINLEAGMPTVEVARNRLSQELMSARAGGAKALKIIHGYGSSGKGGAIKKEVHSFLSQKKRSGMIREYVPGEHFSPFGESARRALELCPELARDSDYSRGNDGITIAVF